MTFSTTRPLLLATVLGFMLQGTGSLEPSTQPRIEDLAARRDGDRILVSFHVAGAFHEDTVDRIMNDPVVRDIYLGKQAAA